jgi:hypothetical protein
LISTAGNRPVHPQFVLLDEFGRQGCAMIDELDVWRAVNLLIEQNGDEAVFNAARWLAL